MTKPRTSFIAGALALMALVSAPSWAPPITFNTALPVPKGTGVFRLQSKYLQSTDDSSSLDRELEVLAFPLVVAYGASRNLALFAIAPLLDKSLEVNTPLDRRARSTSGLGDTTLLARYTLLQRDRSGGTTRVSPFVGVEAPTGEDRAQDGLGRLPQPLQLGSGSWDFILGTVATWQTLRWEVDTSLSYKLNSEANGFDFGDQARLDLSYPYRMRPRELGEGVPAFLYAVLESNVIWQDRNSVSGLEDPSSGGLTWFLAPGLQYGTRRYIVEAAIQIPLVQDLNGAALENDFITTLSGRVNF